MKKLEPRIGKYNWLLARNRLRNYKEPEKIEAVEESLSSQSEPEDYFDVYEADKNLLEQWPSDYWKIKKLTRYINKGNFTLSTIAIFCLTDCDFSDPITLQALKDENEINILLNMLHSDNTRLKIVSLRCVQKLALIKSIRYEIVYFGGLQSILPLLWEPSFELRSAAANAIANIAVFHRAWKMVRLLDGIPLLANLLYAPRKLLRIPPNALTAEEKIIFEAASAGARALNVLCEDKKNKKEFWKCGALHICGYIVQSNHTELLTAVIGLLQRCATKKYFRTAIRKLGILVGIQRHLYGSDRGLTQISAQAVFKCAEDIHSREFFGHQGFVEKMYEIISNTENHVDEELMASVSGALWKCAKSKSNVVRLHSLGGIPLLLGLLRSYFMAVQVHIAGCLGLCFRYPPCCEVIRKYNGIEVMVSLLSTTYAPLIVNLNKAMAEASHDPESMLVIENLNAIEKVWSHLRNTNLWVVSQTAWSLCSLLENVREPTAYVRSLIGGLEVIVNLMSSKYTRVSTPACNIVVVLSRHVENLSLLTEYGVVKILSGLVTTKCKRLRYYLCMAIYYCCPLKSNLRKLGKSHIVKPLIKILKSKTPEVRAAACYALCRTSVIPKCSQLIFQSKSAQSILFRLMNNDDVNVQKCAATTIQNIRLFSLLREDNYTDFLKKQIDKRRKKLIGGAIL